MGSFDINFGRALKCPVFKNKKTNKVQIRVKRLKNYILKGRGTVRRIIPFTKLPCHGTWHPPSLKRRKWLPFHHELRCPIFKSKRTNKTQIKVERLKSYVLKSIGLQRELLPTWTNQIHPAFHASLLKNYHGNR